MKQIHLSAREWHTPRQAHEALKAALSFPEYYGCNLDALHDCLGDLGETELVIEDWGAAFSQAPEKAGGFLQVFLDAAEENPQLKIQLISGQSDYGQ